jgi:hypothetical protein
MRGVSGVSKGGPAAGARGAATRTAGGFCVGGAGAAPGAATAGGSGGAAPAAAVGLSLLAAQENGGGGGRRGEGRNAAARRRAAAILDEMRGLQAELLGGRPDPARLARLAALGEGDEATDPGLREAVRAVALRARIELARRPAAPAADRTTTVR